MNSGYQRHAGLFSAIMLIAGSMIGSGVFSVSPSAIRETGPTQPHLLSQEICR